MGRSLRPRSDQGLGDGAGEKGEGEGLDKGNGAEGEGWGDFSPIKGLRVSASMGSPPFNLPSPLSFEGT